MVRLVGLYHCQRGAHTFFLKMKEVARPGGYVVNLIHYEDAARLAMSVSSAGWCWCLWQCMWQWAHMQLCWPLPCCFKCSKSVVHGGMA